MIKNLLLPVAALLLSAAPVMAQDPENVPITMPDYVEPLAYVDSEGNMVYVAIDGKYLYLQGLSTLYPEFTVRADYNNGIASIPQWQFVQNYGPYEIYTRMWVMDYNDEDILEFYPAPADFTYNLTVNLTNGIISCEKEDAFVLFGFATYAEFEGVEDWQWVDYRQNLYLKEYVDYTGVPVNPTNLELEKYDGDEFYSFMFSLPLKATNDNPLSVYDTYYVIYVNGEEYEFVPDEEKDIYAGVPYPVTEMPAYFSNDNDIVTSGEGHLVGLYVDNIESVGVQTVYKYNDEITKSEIIAMENAGVNGPAVDAEEVFVEYFDLTGRKIVNPDKGVYIKRTQLSDGTSKSLKVVK